KNNALTPEDEELHQGRDSHAEELKQLCAKAGIAYQPFDPDMDEEDTRPGAAILGSTKPKHRKGQISTGYASLDVAKPGAFLNLETEKKQTPLSAAAAVAGATPQNTAVAVASVPLPTAVSATPAAVAPNAATPSPIPQIPTANPPAEAQPVQSPQASG